MPHAEHDKHLCYLHNMGYVNSNLDKYKELVKGGQYVCKACGRVAGSEKNLCVPEKI
jgi:hypothetical protein